MRWIRYIFALFSFVLLMLWGLSYFYTFSLGFPYPVPDTQIEANSYWGRVAFGKSIGGPPGLRRGWFADMQYVDKEAARFHRELMNEAGMDLPAPNELPNFDYKAFTHVDLMGHWRWEGFFLTFPLWLPTLLFGTWPAIALTRHIKRRYFSPGVCRKCGYDLRGTPSGVCPECGRASQPSSNEETPPSNAQV